jgi:ankyrin repeat protein
MNGGSDSTHKSLAHSPSSASHSTRFNPPASPTSTKRTSPSVSRQSPLSPRATRAPSTRVSRGLQNGLASSDAASRNEESEAETEILSSDDQIKTKPKKRLIKPGKDKDGREPIPVTTKSEPSRSHPSSRRPSVQGSTDGHEEHSNGAKGGNDTDTKPKSSTTKKSRSLNRPTMSSSRAQSADLAPSRPSPTSSENTAPTTKPSERSRTSLSVEPRKRKLSAEHQRNKLEPPRQRPRLDSVAKSTQGKRRNGSPTSPVVQTASSHRRSASTQSAVLKATRNKRREASTNSQASDSKDRWDDESSEDSDFAGHKLPPVPHLAPPRSGRLASRALNSPVRNAPLHSRRADKYGTTPLAKACERGKIDEVKRAYEQAPEELDQEDNGGFTPLQKASLGGHFPVVKFLLDKGCRIDCCSREERDTPLIDAVENQHFSVVKLLLDRGVNPHHSNKKGDRAIDAIDEEKEFAVEIRAALEKAMRDYQIGDEDHEQPSSEGPTNPTQRDSSRLSTRPDLLYQQMSRDNLLRYSTKGDVEAVVMLLESVNADNAIAVAAARGGHYDVLSFILASNSPTLPKDPDPVKHNDETPLLAAIGRGHLNIITLLLDQDNFNPTRRTKDGKTYYEVSDARRGPRWQAEMELLKERYEQYKVQDKQGKTVLKKKRLSDAKPTKSPSLREKSSAPKSPKLSKVKSKAETTLEERKTKRLSAGKDAVTKDGQRRKRRVVEEDSSHDEESEENLRRTKSLQRRRASSNASKSTKIPDDAQSQASSKFDDTKPKSSRKSKEVRRIKSEPSLDDEDVIMNDAHDDSEDAEGEIDPQVEIDLQVKRDAEQQKRDEAEAKVQAEIAAIAAEERAKAEAENLKRQHEEEEKQRADREKRLDSLPLAIRRAIEFGDSRPLRVSNHSDDSEGPMRLGILNQFSPVLACSRQEIEQTVSSPANTESDDLWTLSFYLIGFLGLSDFSLSDYAWPKIEATSDQLTQFFKTHNMAPLAHDHTWLEMGQHGYSHETAQSILQNTKHKCINMTPMFWITLEDFEREVRNHDRFKDVPIKWLKTNALCPKSERPIAPASFWDVFDKKSGSATPTRFPQSPLTPNGVPVEANGISKANSPTVETATTPLVNGLRINGENGDI